MAEITAVELLEEMAELLKLHEANIFKIRAFEKAIDALQGVDDLKERAKAGTLTEIPGIGKGIEAVLTEFLLHGKSTEKDELRKTLPKGLWELTRVSGLGPKKAKQVIEELGIHTLGELEYACKENRLLLLKGFGEKIQSKILHSLQFLKAQVGWIRVDEALLWQKKIEKELSTVKGLRFEETGQLARKSEVLNQLEWVVSAAPKKEWNDCPVQVLFHVASAADFEERLWGTRGSAEFLVKADRKKHAHIPIEMRESTEALKLEAEGQLKKVIDRKDLQGIFHVHTTASDGSGSLEDMVEAAKNLGYRYIGITDHSESAFYAQGLKADALKKQEKEVRNLQERFSDLRIFWGIESDILADGELDYSESILKRFDFVIASVHSRFQMDRKAMTERLLNAVRNPYTRMLGHPTGRLLLGRPAYDFDFEKIIEVAAKKGVAIELNSHPARLDVDWRMGPVLRETGVWVAINPDAHEIEGLKDTEYGVWMARKALLPRAQVLNALSAPEIEAWFKR
jgi:DNA polymerase (family 10)